MGKGRWREKFRMRPPTPLTVYIAFFPWHQTYRRNRKRKPLRHAWVLQKKSEKSCFTFKADKMEQKKTIYKGLQHISL
jgi:hypothetical protein